MYAVCTYMSPIADNNVDEPDDNPTLSELLHVNDNELNTKDGNSTTAPSRKQDDQTSAPTGPLSDSPVSIRDEEPPRRLTGTAEPSDAVALHKVSARDTIPKRKHRAGRQVKARRLRAQLRLGPEFHYNSRLATSLPTPTCCAYQHRCCDGGH